MKTTPITRRVKYQEELNPDFGKRVASMSGGENLYSCIQCGTCSSTCPLSVYMDHTPRKIMAMTRAGFEKDVLSSSTIWLCASCYACSVDCPREIKITEVMYSLKRLAIEKKVYPKRFAVPVLAKEFFKSVFKTGRSNEMWTVFRTFLKTQPLKLIANAGMGMKLMLRGRMSPKVEKMSEDPKQLQRLLRVVHEKKKETL